VAAAYLAHPTLKPPFLAVVVSGGHTSLYLVSDYNRFEEIGATRDDAAGEAFDKIGRVIGLPYPAGAAMDKLAHEGTPMTIPLPSPALTGDTLDFSFSGIKTAALNYINSLTQKGEEIPRADLAASYTERIVSAVTAKAKMAMAKTGMKQMVLAGGVAANSHLRAALSELCEKIGATLFVPPVSLCGDNAAMIAAAGYYQYLDGDLSDTSLNASANDDGSV
jgi:N6-L-threonylcarbamoyladenine synthase